MSVVIIIISVALGAVSAPPRRADAPQIPLLNVHRTAPRDVSGPGICHHGLEYIKYGVKFQEY